MTPPTPTSQGAPQYIILREGTTREKGSAARENNIMAAKAVADALRTTLGPKGMDKMLITTVGDVLITNDGATILKRMDVAHPAARMLVEVALSQEREAGDGTKTAVILAGELLSRAEVLVESVHPTVLSRGYRLAADEAKRILARMAKPVLGTDEATLLAIARTSMGSKLIAAQSPVFANIAMRAARALARIPEHGGGAPGVDLKRVKFVKRPGGELSDSAFVEGIILERSRGAEGMPRLLRDARVLILDDAVNVHKLERAAKLTIRDPSRLGEFAVAEQQSLQREVERVLSTGATAVFVQGEIAPEAMMAFERAGVVAVEKVTKDDANALARATGARSTQTSDATADDVGRAGTVEERALGESKILFVTDCPGARSISILLRGGSGEVLDEAQRTLEDALGVLRDMLLDGRALPGAGAPEIEVALGLRRMAARVGGREQLAIDCFADAVEIIPRTLAENAGHDAIDALVLLRAEHEKGNATAGVSTATGKPIDAWSGGIVEPLRVKEQAIESATEVASMILRIDEVVAARGKEKKP